MKSLNINESGDITTDTEEIHKRTIINKQTQVQIDEIETKKKINTEN